MRRAGEGAVKAGAGMKKMRTMAYSPHLLAIIICLYFQEMAVP